MRRSLTPLLVLALVVCACTKAPVAEHPMDAPMDHAQMNMQAESSHFSIVDKSANGSIAFMILKDGEPSGDYGILHEKAMHLIVVRDDLTNFEHLHPAVTDDGTWNVEFIPEQPGHYWYFANFADAGGNEHVLRFDRDQDGDVTEHAIQKKPDVRTKTVGKFTVKLSEQQYAGGTVLRYDITDAKGKPVELEPYLGSRGHSVLVSENGSFLHTHDVSGEYVGGGAATDPLDFLVSGAKDPFYRAFTQFQIKGTVYTVDFDWENPS